MIKKFLWITLVIVIGLIIVGIGPIKLKAKVMEKSIKYMANKSALIVVFDGFQPKEYYPVKEILTKSGINVTVLAVNPNPKGMDGKPIDKYDLLIADVNVTELAEKYDAVVLIGGAGVYMRVVGQIPEPNMPKVYELVREFYNKGKIVAAICASPAILAKAGVLKGKKATVWSSPFDKTLIDILEENGAIYTGKDVEIDGNIITANGPNAAEKFAKTIVETLAKK